MEWIREPTLSGLLGDPIVCALMAIDPVEQRDCRGFACSYAPAARHFFRHPVQAPGRISSLSGEA